MYIRSYVRFASSVSRNLTIKFSLSHPVRFDKNRISDYLLPVPERFNSVFNKLRMAFMYPMEKVHPFMLMCNTRTETPQYMEYFSLEFNNQTSKLLFTILHIWFIHRGFHRNNLETRKLLIWEYLWDRMRDILIASGGDSDTYERKLVDMQSRTFGLCLSFDEAFDFYYENGDPIMIKNIINRAFYNNDKDDYGSEKLDRLTFYSIMMESFMTQLPKRELKYALFHWPEFDFTSLESTAVSR